MRRIERKRLIESVILEGYWQAVRVAESVRGAGAQPRSFDVTLFVRQALERDARTHITVKKKKED